MKERWCCVMQMLDYMNFIIFKRIGLIFILKVDVMSSCSTIEAMGEAQGGRLLKPIIQMVTKKRIEYY